MRLRTLLQEGSLLSSPDSQKTFVVLLFVECEKMDDILMQLNLETLAAVFQGEIIVSLIVQSTSNEKIEQLFVTAIGDRVRLRELCKKTKRTTAGHRLLSKCWKPVNKQNG